jgi:hypothetical protein
MLLKINSGRYRQSRSCDAPDRRPKTLVDQDVKLGSIPKAAIRDSAAGNAVSAANLVRNRVDRVSRSDVDLLGDLDRVIDLDAKVAHGGFDLRMAEQKLNISKVPRSPVDQHCLRAPQ